MDYTKGLLKSYSRGLSRDELYDEAMIAYYEQGAAEEGYPMDDWCNHWIEQNSAKLLDQSKEGIEMETKDGEGLVDVPESNVRIVCDLEGALLEFTTPDRAVVSYAWLTVEEGTQEGGFAAHRYRVKVTSFADGSFHLARVPGDDWMNPLT